MSETLFTEFRSSANASDVMEAVELRGAAAVSDFLPPYLLTRAANVLRSEPMYTDDNPNGEAVDRHHDLIQYGYSHEHPWPVATASGSYAPEPVYKAAQAMANYVNNAVGVQWAPNEIMGHNYNTGDYIRAHRDSARAVGYVAVLTLLGEGQEFHFEDDTGSDIAVPLRPGTLTIMRGMQAGADGRPRPRHWVTEATEQRLAISLRHMAPKRWD